MNSPLAANLRRIDVKRCGRGSPFLDTQPDKVGSTEELDGEKGGFRSGEQSAKAHSDNRQLDQERRLQAQNGRERCPIAVPHACAHADHGPRPRRDRDDDRGHQEAEPDGEGHFRR